MQESTDGISKFAIYLLEDEEFLNKRIKEQEEYIDQVDTYQLHFTNPLYEDKLEKRDSALERLIHFREKLIMVKGKKEVSTREWLESVISKHDCILEIDNTHGYIKNGNKIIVSTELKEDIDTTCRELATELFSRHRIEKLKEDGTKTN